ncbi:MAG: recombination mediator RecR [Bacillales bacterium]|nr:recombination mediator RecR [Bacillales bacterium]MDY6003224.1 recombination mediator RecR [Bacilli bacterium]
MEKLPSIEQLIESFASLPGVGHKSAEKMAYSVLNMDEELIEQFADSLINVKKSVHKCPRCGSLTENDLCEICLDESRDKTSLIVVSEPKDVMSFEKIGSFKGQYHVLGGVLSALKGIGVEDLEIESLIRRIEQDNVKEVILATNPTTEGETTALYIAKILEGKDVNVSRLAFGLPVGGHLEYADSLTLQRALEGRKKI